MKKRKRHSKTPIKTYEARKDTFPTVLIILVIAIIIVALVILLSGQQKKTQPTEIIEAISSTSNGFVKQDSVDSLALVDFDNDYEQIRRQSGIEGEFYVYFEDEDGSIVTVDGQRCFGSPLAPEVDPRCQ